MKEILDQEQFTEETPLSATFAKLAFAVAILTLCLGGIITYLIIQVPDSLIDVDRTHYSTLLKIRESKSIRI